MKVTLIDSMGDDFRVADAARVSFHKQANEFTTEQNEKLIKYLAKHKHYSPFGHCFASFHVKAPIFVARQLQKHEYLRMNEVSRRYVDDTPEFYVPEVWRGRPVDKKQGSSGVVSDKGGYIWASVDEGNIDQLTLYKYLLDKGIAPEQARMVLPQSMYTEWFWSGSLDAFANMAKLRLGKDSQEETREIAKQISNIMEDKFPISWSSLVNESL